jgi:hypothetical protein
MENNNFWQFSDDLRLQTNLSLNDSIWSTNYSANKERRNFDFRNPVHNQDKPALGFVNNSNDVVLPNNTNFNGYSGYGSIGSGLNGGFNKGIFPSNQNQSQSFVGFNNNFNGFNSPNGKGIVNNSKSNDLGFYGGGKFGKKGKNRENNGNKEGNGEKNCEKVDKRFKTLPASEALPRNETIGGYIFVCNNDTMAENLKRELFGLPPRYRDSVRAITPGLPLFLYNYSTHQLHGIFEAASFGGTNIDPSAWEDKKNPGESRFPAQVRVITRKICEPLEEDSFRPILHHYDGPKFRLELNVPEALSLLDIFAETDDAAFGFVDNNKTNSD